MSRPDLSDDQAVQAYRKELRAVGRRERLIGFGCVLVGALAVLLVEQAGSAGPTVLWIGYAFLAVGWALMLAAIFQRTRYHRRRMREVS